MMKRLLVILIGAATGVLGAACVADAQDVALTSTVLAPSASESNAAADFAETSAASSGVSKNIRQFALVPRGTQFADSSLANSLAAPEAPSPWATAIPTAAAAPAAEPAASPEPRFVFGGRDDFRFQLALGISLVRFRSQVFYATGVGTSTSLTYFTNEWLGFEGDIVTSFAPEIEPGEHVKYVGYGGGPKIAWRRPHFEPWVHALAGGIHILPQTALGGQNAVAFQVGTGGDYRLNPRFSFRVGLDWVPMHLWGRWQHSAQASLSAVLHF